MTRPAPSFAPFAFAALAAFAMVPALGCDKIPGLGKKDADGGTASSGAGGGILSFLGGTFEGEITMNVSGRAGSGGPKTMVFGLKTPKVRIDAAGGVPTDNPMLAQGASFIIDTPAKKAYVLMPAQKRAMLIDFEKAKALSAGLAPGAPGKAPAPAAAVEPPPSIVKTGKKSVVAGYECEEWKVTQKATRADICVAEGIKWIDLSELGLSSPEVALAAAAGDANRFPLRVVAFDEKGESARMEAVKVEKKALAESQFVVPPDYQVMDLGALMGGLPGLGGKPGGAVPGLPGFVPPQPKKR